MTNTRVNKAKQLVFEELVKVSKNWKAEKDLQDKAFDKDYRRADMLYREMKDLEAAYEALDKAASHNS